MTPAQIELARHALGFSRPGVKESYRNYFAAGPGHDDYAGWTAMVEGGFAVRRDGATRHFGGADMFHLTRTGAQAALRRGERLSYEDFPPDLVIPVNGIYFDQILAGEKHAEYRLRNDYWNKRLMGRKFARVVLTRGYPKGGGVLGETRIELPWRGYDLQTILHPHFGDEPVAVYAIDVSPLPVEQPKPEGPPATAFLIWSDYHNCWHCRSSTGTANGYTSDIAEAGVFDPAVAKAYDNDGRNRAVPISEAVAPLQKRLVQVDRQRDQLLAALAQAEPMRGEA